MSHKFGSFSSTTVNHYFKHLLCATLPGNKHWFSAAEQKLVQCKFLIQQNSLYKSLYNKRLSKLIEGPFENIIDMFGGQNIWARIL